MTSDPRTPVIVGVGQAAERVGDAGYRGMSAVDLATAAVQAALLDCAAPHCGAVTEAIDVVAGTRQFEITGRDGPGVLGRSTNYPRSVANRVGAGSARAVLDVVGGQGPQRLLNEFAAAIAAGDIDAALLFGSDNSSTLRHLAGAEPLSRLQIGQLLAERHPELKPSLESGSLREYQGAPRPPDTSLNCDKIQSRLSFALPGLSDWLQQHPEDEF